MPRKPTSRLKRTLVHALEWRDRVEMRAAGKLLSAIEPKRRGSKRAARKPIRKRGH